MRNPTKQTAKNEKHPASDQKRELHPRNQHRGAYDFPQLIAAEPGLAMFVTANRYGNPSLDFANPAVVKLLNRALLRYFYQVNDWDIPAQYLCPPIPGRADYLHYLADVLAAENAGVIPHGHRVRVLDIGTGANVVYPLIGQHEYGWQFVGADIDATAIANGERILQANPALLNAISLRRQTDSAHVFSGIVQTDERFDLTLCNPPFHASLAEARAGTERKLRGLALSSHHSSNHSSDQGKRRSQSNLKTVSKAVSKAGKPVLNFGGQGAELHCPGGEAAFIKRMIAESVPLAKQVFWFTTLVSKSANLPGIYRALELAGVYESKTVAMAQGQKQSRFVAWTFLDKTQRQEWRQRWCQETTAHCNDSQ